MDGGIELLFYGHELEPVSAVDELAELGKEEP